MHRQHVTMKEQCSLRQPQNLTYVLPMQSCLFHGQMKSLGRPRMFTIIPSFYTARRVRFRYLNVPRTTTASLRMMILY